MEAQAPVLLAVTGMSPAVLTETIWALAHEPEPVVPSRIIVLTTTEGRQRMKERLFQPSKVLGGRTPWLALREALEAEGHDLTNRLRFGATPDDIRVITAPKPLTAESEELADLRTPQDNEAAADFLLEHVRGVVENPDTPLIASIAGGRKTMGALLYACMTLVGRETDRLTHVLVNEPFETIPEFWFPGQPGGPLSDRQVQVHDPAQARVDLADVPFVPLRNLFRKELGRVAGRFLALVDQCREQIRRHAGDHVRLVVEMDQTAIEVNGTRVSLAPREHLVMLFLATRAKRGEPLLGSYIDAVDPLNQFREEVRATAPGNDFSDWRYGGATQSKFTDDHEIRRALSGIRSRLRKAGGNADLLIPCLPERGRFGLSVPGSLIQIR